MLRLLFLTTLCSLLSLTHPGLAENETGISPINNTATLDFGAHIKSFGTVLLGGEPGLLERPFSNSSGRAYTGLRVTFTGPEAAAFSAELPDKIESYNDATLRFRFTPQKVGPHGAKATLTWTGQTGPAPEFYLGGTGAYGAKATLEFPVLYGYTHTALAELPNGNVLMAVCRDDGINAPFSRLRELRPDGTETDLSTKYTIQGKINALAVQSDGKYLIAGSITALVPNLVNDGDYSSAGSFGQVFRFNQDGTVDESFTPVILLNDEERLSINAIAIQPNGKIYLGGKGTLGNQRNLIRLNADGTPDTQPLPSPDGEVYALSVLEDGRVMVGGAFQSMSGPITLGLARLNADGSVDSSFNNPGFCFVTALASWSDQTAIAGLMGSLPDRVAAPTVSVNSPTGSTVRVRYFPTQSLPEGIDAEGLKALSPRAVSMQAGGDVIAVYQSSPRITGDTPTPVFHLQNTGFGGGSNLLGPRQFFQGKVQAALLQRDGKVLVAGEMTQATRYGAGIVNMTGNPGYTDTLLPLIPSSYLTGFAQLDVSGFVDYQPLTTSSNGLAAYSDGLSTARLGNSPLYFTLSGSPSVTFTGPDADQFTVSQQSYSWLIPALPNLPGPITNFPDLGSIIPIGPIISPPPNHSVILPIRPEPPILIGWPISSQTVIHTKANRPGPLRAVAHIRDHLLFGSPENAFDLALEAGFEPGPLGHLQVKETSSPAPLTSGALTQFPETPVGSKVQRTYLLKNNNTEILFLDLSITGAQAGEFQLSTASVTLNPGQSSLVTTTFKPTTNAGSQASLEIRIPYFSITLGPRIDPDWHFEVRLQGTGSISRLSLITPVSCIARQGEATSFEVPAFLDENPTCQWFRDEKPIPGATSRVFTLDAVTLADAGTYQVRVLRPEGPVLSSPARLVVLGVSPSAQSFVLGKPVKLSQPFKGKGLEFQWFKDGCPLSDTAQVKGSRSATLTLTAPQLADAVTYACQVTLGEVQLTGATIQLDPVLPPAITLAAQRFDWTVGRTVAEQLTIAGSATRFTVTGLPAGVRLNAATGALTGIPTKAGEFTLRITAANGSGSSGIREVPVTVTPLGLYETGTFMGLLARESFIGSGRAGLLNLSVTATGAYSGNLGYYTEPARRMNLVFKGQLEWNAEGRPVVRALLNDASKSSLEVALGDLVGSIRLNTLTAGEIRRVITGRMEPITFNTHLFSSREAPTIASGYARTSVTKTAISTVTGKVPAYGQIIALVASTRACDDGLGLILPIQIWLPKQETFSGWLPVPASNEAIQTTGELGLNYERFIGTPAIEFRFTPRSARFTPPARGQSLLGPDGQTNTLKITFKTGETQFLLITPDNKIIPEEGQTKWLTPLYGRHLQSASINPKTGFFSARTWNPSRYPEATLREGIIEGVTLNAQEKLRGILISINKEDPQPVPVEIEVVPGS